MNLAPTTSTELANVELLIEEDQLDSLKLLGVLQALQISIPTIQLSERREIKRNSTYQSAPLLITPNGNIELFWDILVFLDQHLWNSELQLRDANATSILFELIETCDYRLFPLIEKSALEREDQSSTQRFDGSSRLTQLLQWCLSTERTRAQMRREAKRAHLELPQLSIQDAIRNIQELVGQSTKLPELHQLVFRGLITAVLDWLFEKKPHLNIGV